MGDTIAVIIATIIIVGGYIYLVKRFTKWTLIITASLLSIAGAVIMITTHFEEKNRQARRDELDSITIRASYDMAACSKDFPIAVTILNGSSKTIKKVSWSPYIHIKKHSDNLAKYQYTKISSDRILNPGEGIKRCYSVPKISNRFFDKPNLVYDIIDKDVDFYSD